LSSKNLPEEINRRGFLASVAPAAAALNGAATAAQSSDPVAKPSAKQTIGIQIGSISFLDEGTEKVLDILQEKACVNTLFLATFTYGNGIASPMTA
jgi:hypothetical protein